MAYDLGIIGAGNMAEAIVRGVRRVRLLSASQIIATDISPQRRQVFDSLGVVTTDQNLDVARQSRNLLLSVKPQQAPAVLAEIGAALEQDTRIISIMAGLSTRYIAEQLGPSHRWRIIRVMPNTPMLIGQGIAGICAGEHASPDDLTTARRFFEAASEVIEVREIQMNAVTAMSGSGPAYFFYFVEHMIQAGESIGLNPEQAKRLAIKTALGAAQMLQGSADSPAELRRKVTSPGGTTQAAITHLEKHHAGEIFAEAIRAAQRRGEELGS